MQITPTDPQLTVIKAALEFFRNAKQQSISGPDPLSFKGQVNEYDLLSPEHTLMHTMTLLSKLTGQPITHFANRHPSQQPPTTAHTPGPGAPPKPDSPSEPSLPSV